MSTQVILLDIEGTTSSIDFVFDVMFPFIRKHLRSYLRDQAHSRTASAVLEQVAKDAGHDSACSMTGGEPDDPAAADRMHDHLIDLMDRDVKATGLKQLQGLMWESAFRDGTLRSHLYADVSPAIRRWTIRGIRVAIYSSGSVYAQKLFFTYTIDGDLSPLIGGHWDTTVGGKRDCGSYGSIAQALAIPAEDILFVSDVAQELDAAREAGMQTRLSVRPGNKPVEASCTHVAVTSFDEIDVCLD